jgi:hypothetical protein
MIPFVAWIAATCGAVWLSSYMDGLREANRRDAVREMRRMRSRLSETRGMRRAAGWRAQ